MSKTLSLGLIAALIFGSGPGLVQAVPSSANLVAHWSFDQSSGTALTDDSGNGHTGTLYKTPTWTAGQFNNSLKFDGTDYANIGNLAEINGVSKLTLATWIKRSSSGSRVLVGKQTTNQDVAIEAWDDGRLYFQMSKGADTYGSVALNDTAWHHVALVYDGTLTGNANRLKGYVDGVQQTLSFHGTVANVSTTNTTPLRIARLGSDYSNGQVDDTWLYARTLSQAELVDLMGGAPADTAAPSVPADLSANAASQSQINLSWTASTDDTAVAGYRVYRNGGQVGTSVTTSYQDTGLAPSTAYSYTVRAYDAATNVSGDSNTASATTMDPAPAPTANITATPGAVPAGGSATLNWTSTDATSCTASGAWTGAKAVSGSQVVSGIAANSTYTLTCNGAGGQAVAAATVTVLPQCSDGLDNDGDGLADMNDPGCSSTADNDETDPDVTAPTAALTAPADGATVSGSVNVDADATDNVGVAGVKFYAGAIQIGSEDTVAPYSVSWNTNTAANGPVALTAVARDAAGNTTTAAAVNVTVNNVVTTRFVTSISANGRYFQDQTGAPILVKGDSPWSMFVDLSAAQGETWAANREGHGFNTAIISLLGNTVNGGPSDSGATYDGVLPFNGGNITSFNEAYWSRVDSFMTSLKNHGITVFLYPVDGWVTLPGGVMHNKSAADTYTYGRMVAQRYANYPNIVWMGGGDYYGTDSTINAQFQATLNGIRSTGDTRMFGMQLQAEEVSTDVAFFEPLINFNFAYTYSTTYQKVLRAYNRPAGPRDPRPVIFNEGNYEGEDLFGGLPTTNETLRRQQLWALTSGAAGEFTGSQDWQFLSGWQNRLDTTWITQAQKNREFFSSLTGWQLLVPDNNETLVTAGRGTKITSDGYRDVRSNDYVTAAQTPDKSLAVVYVPTATSNTNARTITLNLAQLPASYTATWVDPTNATSTQAAAINGSGQVTTPGLHSDNTRDWLLVIKAN